MFWTPSGRSSCHELKEIEMFQDLPRRNTMFTGCVLIALIPAAVGAVGLNSVRQMSRGDQRLYDNSILPAPELSKIAILLQRMRIASRDFIGAEGDPARRMTLEGQLSSLAADLDRVSGSFERRNLSPGMQRTFEEYKSARTRYAAYLARILSQAKAGREKEAWAILWSDDYNAQVNEGLKAA